MPPSTVRWPSAAAWRGLSALPPWSLWCGTCAEILEVRCWCTCIMMACWNMVKRGSAGACTLTAPLLLTLSWHYTGWRWKMLGSTGARWQSGGSTAAQASGPAKHQTSHSLRCSECCLQVTSGSLAAARSQEDLCLCSYAFLPCYVLLLLRLNTIYRKKWLLHFSQ